MKRIVKILSLALFIILFFGITTTSKAAYKVSSSTSAEKMLAELRAGQVLTGISSDVMHENKFIFCRDKSVGIFPNGEYKFVNNKESDAEKIYPDDEIEENGYLKSFILSAPNIASKEGKKFEKYNTDGYWDSQHAWWKMLYEYEGHNKGWNGTSYLFEAAKVYQKYKKDKTEFKVNNDNAKTNVSNNILTYGPISITYKYEKYEGGTSDDKRTVEFGGFDFAFFAENNAITDGVELIIHDSGRQITSNNNDAGYKEVRTHEYNNVKLDIRVDLNKLKNINKINIRIQENDLNCKATIYEIEGEGTYTYNTWMYCDECNTNLKSMLKESPGDAVGYSNNHYYPNGVYRYNNLYYQFDYHVTKSYPLSSSIKLNYSEKYSFMELNDRSQELRKYSGGNC